MFIYFVIHPALSFWNTRQKVEYKYKRMVVVTLLASVITPSLSILLLKATDIRAKAIILGYLIAQTGLALFFYVFEIVKGKVLYNEKYWLYALKFNIPLIPHYLSLIILGQSDRVMIRNICGNSAAGIYSFAYQIANAMIILASAINGSRVPWAYEQLKKNIYNRLQDVANFLCIFFGIITLCVSLIAPEVVKILAKSEYMEAIYVIPVVALGIYFTSIYELFCGVEFYYSATQYVMIASCIGAVVNIILNAVFIPIFGFIAAGYTTLFCYIVVTLMHFLFMRKVCKKHNINDAIFNIRVIFNISMTISVAVFLSMLTYKHDIVRFMVLVLLLLSLFFQKDKLMDIFKSKK